MSDKYDGNIREYLNKIEGRRMNNNCNHHGWTDKDNEPCPYCIIDQLRAEVRAYREALRLKILENDLLRERLREVDQ